MLGGLTSGDREQLASAGIAESEVERQLELLKDPPAPPRLLRPCTPGDGILRLAEGEQRDLLEEWQRAAEAGRLTKFVPASGAATRMFRGLDDPDSPQSRRFAQHAEAFPPLEVLRTQPKALLPFHRYPDGTRTALSEQLVEGAGYLTDRAGQARFHFTIAPEHRQRFEEQLAADLPWLRRERRLDVVVGLSSQSPATDTIALDDDGRIARGSDGTLLLRPAGHGALIANLGDLGADLVFIKNIDNVLPETRQELVIHWKRVLAGLLVTLERQHDDSVPLRVCGMVRNTGEPGGGPFWVDGAGGVPTLQIVEAAQVAPDPDQRRILTESTHFNPVDLVCSLRRSDASPYDLLEFVDRRAVVISRKTHEGRALRTLERPGLWNGAMSRWKTVFVEVPAETFAPVKTIFDLLRPEHSV